jgi:hypothetical protein
VLLLLQLNDGQYSEPKPFECLAPDY